MTSDISIGELRKWSETCSIEMGFETFVILAICDALVENVPLFYTPDPSEGKIYKEAVIYAIGLFPKKNIIRISETFIKENSRALIQNEKS